MKNTYKVLFSFSILVFVTSCSSYKSTNNELDALLVATQQTMKQLAEKMPTTEKDSLTTAFTKLEEKSKELFPVLVNCNKKYKPDGA